MKLLIIIFIGIAIFKGCSDGDGNLNSNLENSTFNVYFYFPDNHEYYLGQVRGLSQCQAKSWDFANEKSNGETNFKWDYICCLQTSTSSCSEKHK